MKMQLDRLQSYFKNEEPESQISILELKRLLVLLAENVQSVCIRYRMVGKMWEPNFFRVVQVTDKGLFLKDESTNRTISIPDIRMIIQFELDGCVHTFQPNYHYNVALHPDGK